MAVYIQRMENASMRLSHWPLRQLSEQDAVTTLDCDSMPRELVVGGEAGCVDRRRND
jgi:hypothetical protein